jgi:hypothetical protein
MSDSDSSQSDSNSSQSMTTWEKTVSNANDEEILILSELPWEMQRHVFSFLHPIDAVKYTNRHPLQVGSVVRALQPDRHLEQPERPVWCSSRPGPTRLARFLQVTHQLRLISKICNENVHSMTFRTKWQHSGRSEGRGKLLIVAKPLISSNVHDPYSPDRIYSEELCDGGRVVSITNKTAPANKWRTVELTFTPKEGEVYYLWYQASSRIGSHYLYLKDCNIQTYVYDDMERSFSETYRVLHNHVVVSFSNL